MKDSSEKYGELKERKGKKDAHEFHDCLWIVISIVILIVLAISQWFLLDIAPLQRYVIRSYPKNLNKMTIQPNCTMDKKLLR